MALSQKQIIVAYLKEAHTWLKSYDLMLKQTPYGWIGSQGDRRARELAQEGLIYRRHDGKYAEYSFYNTLV